MSEYTTKQFAVLRFDTFKSDTDITRLGKHIDRTSVSDNVDHRRTQYNETFKELSGILDGTINSSKSAENQHFTEKNSSSLLQDIEKRIEEGYNVRTKSGELQKIRKDAPRAIFTILSGSHERMQDIVKAPKLLKSWIEANIAFAKGEFGDANIVRMTLHMDEKTPHFHIVFVPITKDGRLTAGCRPEKS